MEDARNEIIKELEHLRDMGIIAEEELEALVEKLKSSIETDILDAEMLIHLEAAKAKANLEIDALELVGAITPEQAEAYREEVKAATKPSEVAAVMAKISVHRDFKALNDAIEKAKLKDQHNYMPNSWTSFEIALRHAEEVSETEHSAKPATQIEINDAFDHLLLAELKLERVASTKAIDHLQDAIRVAHSKKEKDYTKESWADMQTVLGEAEAMLAKLDGNVDAFTEKEVNDMTRKLNLAMLSMKRVDGIGGIINPIKPHTPTKPASKPAAASASAPSASASAPKAAASSLPKTGEVTHSLMSAGLLALGMAGYFYMSRKRLEVSGDIYH
ncbi:LPXTG cell wall anchor domain-containing protein [Vagococcus jeotgali]|uniref:LPXTG cell wall anchor domain-containing protein n=1 Tax=Vagococcus jeotgali TaxID=3109030 RepID=UPI002DD8B0AE|nr:LPXTG cell wall anchor domain-containing protein [Vagococcus sp. B2T-5]